MGSPDTAWVEPQSRRQFPVCRFRGPHRVRPRQRLPAIIPLRSRPTGRSPHAPNGHALPKPPAEGTRDPWLITWHCEGRVAGGFGMGPGLERERWRRDQGEESANLDLVGTDSFESPRFAQGWSSPSPVRTEIRSTMLLVTRFFLRS